MLLRKACILVSIFFFIVPAAWAAPNVTGWSGSAQHGQSITIQGSGFGAKSTAAPVAWDDFEDGNFTGWSFVGTGASWEISTSTARGTRSAHKLNSAATDRMQIYPSSNQSYYYTSFWFYPASNYTGNGNDKIVRLGESGGQSNLVFGRDYDTVETTPCSAYDTQVVYRGTAVTAIRGQWNFIEVHADVSGDKASIAVNGSTWSTFPRSGCSTVWSAWDNTPYMAYGAWFGTGGIQGGWYFDDIYIDYTPARVMVCDGSSWASRGQCEMQRPTSWSNSQIAATVNRGGFGATDSAYLYVVDSNGDVNTSGFPITFGDTGEPPPNDTTPPVRSGGYPTGTLAYGSSSTTMGLLTNEPSTCRWSTASGTPFASMTNTFSSTGGTSHSQAVSGLVNGGTYTRFVRCVDGAGNANANDYLIAWSVEESPQQPPVPGVFSWEFSNYDVPRTDGRVFARIMRTEGTAGAVSVRWSSNGQTALHNVDYYGADNQLVEFAAGESEKSIYTYGQEGIALIQNDAPADRYFELVLSNPQGGATIGTPNKAVVTIQVDCGVNPWLCPTPAACYTAWPGYVWSGGACVNIEPATFKLQRIQPAPTGAGIQPVGQPPPQ